MKQGSNGRGRLRGRSQSSVKGKTPSRSLSYDSNGPGVRVRGNALQVVEKYQAMARDAAAQGDRVLMENFLQHAEHYYRIVLSQNVYTPSRLPRVDQANALHPESPGDFLDDAEAVEDTDARAQGAVVEAIGFETDRYERSDQGDRDAGRIRQRRRSRPPRSREGGDFSEQSERATQPLVAAGSEEKPTVDAPACDGLLPPASVTPSPEMSSPETVVQSDRTKSADSPPEGACDVPVIPLQKIRAKATPDGPTSSPNEGTAKPRRTRRTAKSKAADGPETETAGHGTEAPEESIQTRPRRRRTRTPETTETPDPVVSSSTAVSD